MIENRIEKYYNDLIEEGKRKLSENSSLIEKFKELCLTKGIKLEDDNFSYNQRIGIIASFPNILLLLDKNLKIDKESLFSYPLISKNYSKGKLNSGTFQCKDFIVLAHPFFRRGYNENANYAPHFIDLFWGLKKTDIDLSIALDTNRVRINIDDLGYFERDTWYGAKFEKDIAEITDGVSKLTPPLKLSDFHIEFFFNNAHSLNIEWKTKENIKVFQAEEFKTEKVHLEIDKKIYYPARYIHAEYDLEKNIFRHFDGAVHLYTEDEYLLRRNSDFNFNSKSSKQIKTKSIKLFKMNRNVLVDLWIEFTSHFFTGNPLIFEYFEGKYPESINDIINRIE